MRKRIVLLVLLWAGLFLGACRQEAAVVSPARPVTPAGARPAPTADAGAIVRVSVDELWERLQGGEAIVVVDVRGRADYEAGHIPGAISVPEADFAARAAELRKDRLLIFYCA